MVSGRHGERKGKKASDFLNEKEGDQRPDRLRSAGADGGPELTTATESRRSHRDGDAGPLGNVLKGDRKDHEEAESGPIRGEGRAHRQALGKAVDEEDQKDERRDPGTRP